MEQIVRPTHRSILFKRHRPLNAAEVIEAAEESKETTNVVLWLLAPKPIRESQ